MVENTQPASHKHESATNGLVEREFGIERYEKQLIHTLTARVPDHHHLTGTQSHTWTTRSRGSVSDTAARLLVLRLRLLRHRVRRYRLSQRFQQ